MNPFELPEQLPTTIEALDALRSTAVARINLFRARIDAGDTLAQDEIEQLQVVLDARDALSAEITKIEDEEKASKEQLAALLARTQDAPAEDAESTEELSAEGEDDETEPEGDDAPVDEAETEDAPADAPETTEAAAEAPKGGKAKASVTAGGDNRPVNFSGLDVDDAPDTRSGPAWRMKAGAPGYVEGPVGFDILGKAIDSITKGTRKARNVTAESRGEHMAQVIAETNRNLPLITDSHALVQEIERVTQTVPEKRGSANRVPVTATSLVAAGGWCAPSEILYDFCDVPNATDLVSVPEITIARGGVRWPAEPDMTEIFANFEFFFTEPELEATDNNGVPLAVKDCIEIPCPDEFEEMRLNVVGYCVSAGILQTQGWPELITWFMQQLAAEHLRAISRRTILDMVAGSSLQTFNNALLIGTSGAILNSLALLATNIRLNRGLPRDAVIEGVAPNWLLEVIRADWTYRGSDPASQNVTDAQILSWLAARNIALQFVGDWQTRDTGLPGLLNTLTWPSTVDVLLYPAGTWFRAMQNVIEIGIMYPKEQLVLNRYTRMFTEDAIAVGRRCHPSLVARIPIVVNGGIGGRYTLAYAAGNGGGPGATFGSVYGTPVPGGPFGGATHTTLTETGGPTGGTVKLTLVDQEGGSHVTGTIPWNATLAQVQTALEGLSDFDSDAFDVQGGPLNTAPITVDHPQGTTLTVTNAALTGGTSPAVTPS